MRIVFLREQFPWMGKHSGYDLLCDYISSITGRTNTSIYRSATTLPRSLIKALNPIVARIKRSQTYDINGILTELKSAFQAFCHSCDIVHVLYVERTLALLPKLLSKRRCVLVGTVHQPASLWRVGRHETDIIKPLQALIVLSRRELRFFEEFLPGRVHFIPHGIDTDFFRPPDEERLETIKQNPPRCIFSGTWLRDIETLSQVVGKVLQRNANVRFDMLVPRGKQNNSQFYRIARYDQVSWHSNLTDEQLKILYQQANMLVLPLLDCTANNALLEAMACGLPVVTNNVGGIPDYTRDDFANLLLPGDVDGMVDAILALAEDTQTRRERGWLARSYIEKHFNWRHIAEQTIALYNKVSSFNKAQQS